MKARIVSNLLEVIEKELPEEKYLEDAEFLRLAERIQGQVVDLCFIGGDEAEFGDAFEVNDNQYWLPRACWEPVNEGDIPASFTEVRQLQDKNAKLCKVLSESRTSLLITASNIRAEMKRDAIAARRWEGVPEELEKRMADIDAAIAKHGGEK